METGPTNYAKMMSCTAGILGSLVIYGVLQERIVTQPFDKPDGTSEYFHNSLYLVLNNRIVAILVSIAFIIYRKEDIKPAAPIYKCAGVSLSNTIATWCQYEALKYVSFPTQTLGKCGKMIPVMILGLLLQGKKYGWKDFVLAGVVTAGCTAFVLTGEVSDKGQDSIFGLLLMGGYLFSDGFTSTLQEKMFKGYRMSTYNQMLYVNLCSASISLVTLIFQGQLFASLEFSFTYPSFMFSSFLLSLSATAGQLVIYITIKEFGALFFATVMTVRQVISVILSCILFLHPLSLFQWLSAAVVFGTLYYKDVSKPRGHGHGAHGGHGARPPAHGTPPTQFVITSHGHGAADVEQGIEKSPLETPK